MTPRNIRRTLCGAQKEGRGYINVESWLKTGVVFLYGAPNEGLLADGYLKKTEEITQQLMSSDPKAVARLIGPLIFGL